MYPNTFRWQVWAPSNWEVGGAIHRDGDRVGEWQGGFRDKDEQFLFGHRNASEKALDNAEQALEVTRLGSQEKQG